MDKIRVLIIAEYADRSETAMFVALHNSGLDINVILNSNSRYIHWLKEAKVPHQTVNFSSKWDKKGRKIIRQNLEDQDTQILHLLHRRAIFNGLAASRGLGVKNIIYRGVVGGVSFFNPLDWISILSPRVEKIICVADEIRRSLIKLNFLHKKISSNKLVTIYKGHKLEWYKDLPINAEKISIPKESFIIACVANVRPRKGIPVFIEAASMLPNDGSVHFLLIGEGMEKPNIRNYVLKSPQKDNFHILGFREDVSIFLAASHCSVLPCLRGEGLPRSIIESMAYEATPIVTRVGGNPELVKHNFSGLVVEPGNSRELGEAMLSLYRDQDRCKKLSMNAKNTIEKNFSLEDTVKKIIALYYSII